MSFAWLNMVLHDRARRVGLGLGLVALQGCGQESATATLRALDTAGEVSVVCLTRDESGVFTRGAERSACPDFTTTTDSPDSQHLHALVTQPSSGEVALVDLDVNPTDAVVDFEPTQPGYSFMPVGAEPISIASTPGGVASFVAVREPGREGIFGLPSSCVNARPEGAPVRDIRTWPACRLPAAPGPMIMLDDPAIDHDGDATTAPLVRDRCGGEYVDPEALVGQAPAATRAQCPADLASETRPIGRRKLAVTLPSLSEVWVIDAQELLDRDPGSFDACTFEQRLVLGAQVSDAAQRLPADLIPPSPSCGPVGLDYGPIPETYRPWPSDLALDDERRLYISDTEAPLVHVLDASNPCALAPLPSLEPRSYMDPGAVITTRRVAVSPLTPLGKRFVYAVDNSLTRTAGSLMVFDVSPGSTERTPVVRERAPLNPSEPPDRIALGRDVADVEFVFQDSPEPTNAAAAEGLACDPYPGLPLESPEAQYRTNPDLSSGAGPRKLRGTFAFAALHSGQISVIDVEDLDELCRRPISANPAPVEDLFGCKNDDPTVQRYSISGRQTVSGELSCNVVAPHRARGRGYFANIGGFRSAALVAFPTLTLETGRSVTSDQSDEGLDQPRMLAAPHGDAVEQLFVGPLVYETDEQAPNPLEMDPDLSDRNSLLLSYEEPRAYIPSEEFTATYEGVIRQSGQALLSFDATSGLGVINEGLNASLCSSGVQDVDVTGVVAQELGVTSVEDRASFTRRHADYAQLTGAFLEADDPYWAAPDGGAECGAAFFQEQGDSIARLVGRPFCEEFFGPPELPSQWRDLRIVEASEDRLLFEPRDFDSRENSANRRRQLVEFTACCFPGLTSYQLRAGHQWVVRGSATGSAHRVTTDPTSLRCVRDCNPLVQRQQSRAFELSCSENCPLDNEQRPPIGYARADEDFACVVDNVEGGIDPGEPGAECVFQSLTTRFAMYRGQQRSARDMRFRWQLSDGFSPLTIPLSSTERSTPRSLLLLPETSRLVVSDGTVRGITLVSTRSTQVLPSIF